jgi:hypothetical protein
MDISGSKQGQVFGFSEHGNEPYPSAMGEKLLDEQ